MIGETLTSSLRQCRIARSISLHVPKNLVTLCWGGATRNIALIAWALFNTEPSWKTIVCDLIIDIVYVWRRGGGRKKVMNSLWIVLPPGGTVLEDLSSHCIHPYADEVRDQGACWVKGLHCGNTGNVKTRGWIQNKSTWWQSTLQTTEYTVPSFHQTL